MKKALEMIRLGLILAAYAAAACVGLAFVYTGTKTVIEKRAVADIQKALFELFPAADGFKEMPGAVVSPDPRVSFISIYELTKAGAPIGLAVKSVTGSYGGPLTVLTGVASDQTIAAVRIISGKDTPGLGANAGSPTYYVDKKTKTTFYGQFTGKAVNEPFRVKDDVVAITASTITSAAVTRSVKAAADAAVPWLDAALTGETPPPAAAAATAAQPAPDAVSAASEQTDDSKGGSK